MHYSTYRVLSHFQTIMPSFFSVVNVQIHKISYALVTYCFISLAVYFDALLTRPCCYCSKSFVSLIKLSYTAAVGASEDVT